MDLYFLLILPKKGVEKRRIFWPARLTDERIPRTLSSTSWCVHPIPTPSECPENGSGQKTGSQNSTCFVCCKDYISLYKFFGFVVFEGGSSNWAYLHAKYLLFLSIWYVQRARWFEFSNIAKDFSLSRHWTVATADACIFPQLRSKRFKTMETAGKNNENTNIERC